MRTSMNCVPNRHSCVVCIAVCVYLAFDEHVQSDIQRLDWLGDAVLQLDHNAAERLRLGSGRPKRLPAATTPSGRGH